MSSSRKNKNRLHQACVAAGVAAVFALAGCNRDNAGGSGGTSRPAAMAQLDAAAQARAAERIARPAWLRERLPEHTVGYLRLPSPWGLMSAPSGRPLDTALASEAHTKAVAALRDAASKDKLLVDAGIAPFTALFLDELAGPVEAAMIDTSDIANPASNFLISFPLDIADVAALNARITSLGVPLLKAPLDANGKGELATKGYVQFDAATKNLYVLSGMAASAFSLDGFVKQLGEKRAHAMHEVEKNFDTSGQGLFFWMSLKGVAGMASSQIPQARPGTAVRDLIDKSQSVAFGWGTVGGRGKLQFQLNAPQSRLFSYLTQEGFRADVKSAGKPAWALTMRLPTRQQFDAIVAGLDADFGAGTKEAFDKANAEAKKEIGVGIDDFFGLMGPELLAFEDDSGVYTAIRAGDRAAFYKRIDDLAARFGWKHEVVTSGKASVHALYVPGIDMSRKLGEDAAGPDPAKSTALLKLYARMGTRLYWAEEGEWLIFGQVPQGLADRAAAKLDTDVGNWLRNDQSYDPAQSYLGIVGATRHANRKVYYTYLAGLQAVSDFLGQPINLAELPNAAGLNLPTEGALGLALDLTPNRAGVSITYEQTPAEVLIAGGGSMMALAVAGITAAIAIPAYQDYTLRAQVASSEAGAVPVKVAVAEYYAKRKKVPASEEDFEVPDLGDAAQYLDHYWVENGAIVLSFGDKADAKLHGSTLVLTPYKLGNELVWRCGDGAIADDAVPLGESSETTSVLAKYLPTHCR